MLSVQPGFDEFTYKYLSGGSAFGFDVLLSICCLKIQIRAR